LASPTNLSLSVGDKHEADLDNAKQAHVFWQPLASCSKNFHNDLAMEIGQNPGAALYEP